MFVVAFEMSLKKGVGFWQMAKSITDIIIVLTFNKIKWIWICSELYKLLWGWALAHCSAGGSILIMLWRIICQSQPTSWLQVQACDPV